MLCFPLIYIFPFPYSDISFANWIHAKTRVEWLTILQLHELCGSRYLFHYAEYFRVRFRIAICILTFNNTTSARTLRLPVCFSGLFIAIKVIFLDIWSILVEFMCSNYSYTNICFIAKDVFCVAKCDAIPLISILEYAYISRIHVPLWFPICLM